MLDLCSAPRSVCVQFISPTVCRVWVRTPFLLTLSGRRREKRAGDGVVKDGALLKAHPCDEAREARNPLEDPSAGLVLMSVRTGVRWVVICSVEVTTPPSC